MLQSILVLLNVCVEFHMMYEKLTCPMGASSHFFNERLQFSGPIVYSVLL